MNKNTVFSWATFLMVIIGILLISLAVFKYRDFMGIGLSAVGVGFFAIAWVFHNLKGRV